MEMNFWQFGFLYQKETLIMTAVTLKKINHAMKMMLCCAIVLGLACLNIQDSSHIKMGMGTATALSIAESSDYSKNDLDTSLPRDDLWVTNGSVRAIAQSDDVVYIGGEFTYVGPNTGHAAPVHSLVAQPLDDFPKFNGPVNVIVPDGSGGWYVGGDFSHVDGVPRVRLAHVLSDRKLNMEWAPEANDQVLAIAVTNDTVFIGGRFTFVNNGC